MADVKWIKITTDIFDDEKILLIESLPSADSIIVIWFKLLTLAGKQNNDGVFVMSNRMYYTDEMLSTIFRRDLSIVRLALNTFQEFGMIEIVDNVVTIPNWNKHQTLDSYEKKKERDRKYQQERRNKQKMLASGKSSDESPYVAISEREEEGDIEEDKDIEKENTKESAISYFDVENAWIETYKIYPKKSGEATAKVEWMKKVGHSLDIKEVSKLVFYATKLYLSDYSGRYPDDANYKYLPRYDKWLQEDCDYWIRQYEENQRGDDS